MNTPRALYLAAVCFGAIGLALRVVPPPAPPLTAAAPPPARAPVGPPRASGADVGAFRAIVTANVFSPSRSPPATRYSPTGTKSADSATPPPPPRKPAEPALRLYGITKGPSGAVALIDADPKIPGAELYREGDRIKGSPITAITESTVVVARGSRPLVLRLPAAKQRR